MTIATSYLFIKGYLTPLVLTTTQKFIEESTDADVNIGDIEVSIIPSRLILKDVSISIDDEQTLDLKFGTVSASLNPLQALAGSITVNSLVLTEPVLYIAAQVDDLREILESARIKEKVKPRLFKTDIRHVRIEGGTVKLEERGKGAFEIQNPSITLERHGIYGGSFEINVESGKLSGPETEESFTNLYIDGFLSGRMINIKRLTVKPRGGALEGKGKIHLGGERRFEGHIEGEIPVEMAGRYLKKMSEMTGMALFSADFSYGKKGLQLSTTVAVERGKVKDIPFSNLKADISLGNGLLSVKRFSLNALNGWGRFKGEIDLSSGNYNTEGVFKRINLTRLKKMGNIRIKGGISGNISGNGNIRKPSYMGIFTAECGGLSLSETDETAPPLSIEGSLAAEREAIAIKDVVVSAKGLYGEIGGKISGWKEIDLSMTVSAADLPRFTFLFAPSLSGDAKIKGRLYGDISKPSFEGEVDLTKPAIGGYSAERVYGDISYADGIIGSDNLEIAGDESLISVSGTLSLRPPSPDMDLLLTLSKGEISGLMTMANKDWPVDGSISGSLRLKGNMENPSIKGGMEVKNGEIFGESVDRLLVTGAYEDGRFDLEDVKIQKGAGSIALEGSFHREAGMDLTADIRDVEIGNIRHLKKKGQPKGRASGTIRLGGTVKAPVITAEVTLKEALFHGESSDIIEIAAHYSRGVLKIDNFKAGKGDAMLTVSGVIEPEGDINLNLDVSGLDLKDINLVKRKLPGTTGKLGLRAAFEGKSYSPAIKGKVEITALARKGWDISADIAGDLTATANIKDIEDSEAELGINNLDIRLPGKRLKSISPFTLRYVEERFEIAGLSFEEPYGQVTMGGQISLKGILAITLSGTTEIGWLKRYLKGVEELEGRLTFDSRLGGSIKEPKITASLTGKDGMVRFRGFPYSLTNIRGKFSLTPELLAVDEIEGELQGAGFTGGGFFKLERFVPLDTDLYFDIGEVALRYPGWLSSRSRGRITVSGKGKEITLGGDIEVLKATYTEDIEFKELLARIIWKKVKERKEKRRKGLNFNIHFRADDNLIVKNNLADIELKGHLRLIGRPKALSLIGELETVGGKAYFRDREFSIMRGVVTFFVPERIIPFFDINTEANIRDYIIHLNALGRPDKYTIELHSDPPLDEKEIVSLITFGYTGSELKGRGTQMTSLEAVSIILQEELEDKVKKYFGFDRFSIDPYYSEFAGSTEARVTVGKKLRENLSATYSRGISSLQEEEVKLEYRLYDNVSLMGSWSSRKERVGAFGGDVVLRYEFQ